MYRVINKVKGMNRMCCYMCREKVNLLKPVNLRCFEGRGMSCCM